VIVVRIELWPFGDSRRLLALEELTIVNVGSIGGSRCRYEARLGDDVALLVHDREDGPVALAAAALGLLAHGTRVALSPGVGIVEPCELSSEAGDPQPPAPLEIRQQARREGSQP
jgi:hypothetical protein